MNNRTASIYRLISELSNLILQRKLWLNEDNDTGLISSYSGLISSYSELMCSLFDDYDLNGFLDHEAVEHGLSKKLIHELKDLRESLNRYHEEGSDEEIINDPEWETIVEQAKEVLKGWE